MLRPAILTAAALILSTAAHADVWKSVDPNGQIRYSDVWSPGAQLVKGLSLHDGQLSQDSKPAPSAPASSDASKLAAQKEVRQDMSGVRAQQCEQLKGQYDRELHARRIIKPGSSPDDPQYMTDEEADAERVRTKQALDEACAPSS